MQVNADIIVRATAQHYSMSSEQLRLQRGHWHVARMRAVAMFLIRETMGWSYPQIAGYFQMDHSSVQHAVRRTKKAFETEAPIRVSIAAIRRALSDPLGVDLPRSGCCPTCGQEVDRATTIKEVRSEMERLKMRLDLMETVTR